MNTVRIFTDDIKIKFVVSKCSTLVMKRGKKMENDKMQMPRRIAIGDLGIELTNILEYWNLTKSKCRQ